MLTREQIEAMTDDEANEYVYVNVYKWKPGEFKFTGLAGPALNMNEALEESKAAGMRIGDSFMRIENEARLNALMPHGWVCILGKFAQATGYGPKPARAVCNAVIAAHEAIEEDID
jgi:hypothetical protein